MSQPEHIKPIVKRTLKRFRLTAPKPFIPKEYDDQVKVAEWFHGRPAMRVGKYWVKAIPPMCKDPRAKLLFPTLNGVRLPIGLARKMKLIGNNSGVPDWILPVVGYAGCPGLYVEQKREKGGRLSSSQEWWHERLKEQGYEVVVTCGAKETIKAISDYLERST